MGDNVFSVAPAEGHRPIGILNDQHFEEICNPTKYPTGKFLLMTKREVKLTVHKYFNQRLLDADGRFARDIEYLGVEVFKSPQTSLWPIYLRINELPPKIR